MDILFEVKQILIQDSSIGLILKKTLLDNCLIVVAYFR
jgi:hypothetical protein